MRVAWFAMFLFVGSAVLVQAYSSGPPGSTVVANDGCSCHSSSPNSGTVVSVSYPANYLGASKHEIRVTSTTDVIQNPTGNKGGFLAWVSHGSFSKRSGSEDWYQTEALDGKSVIKHNFNGDSTNSAQEWRFDWAPPTTDVGVVTLKVWVNRVNGDGQPSGLDHWNRKHVTMTAEPHGDLTPTTSATTGTKSATTSSKSPTSASSTTNGRPTSEGPVVTDPSPGVVASLVAIAALALVVYRRR